MNRMTCCIFASIVLCGCPGGPQETQLVRDFFQMPISQQKKQFSRYTLDEQWEIYRFGMEVIHPPAIYLADAFAQQGEKVVPFLLQKLAEARENFDVYIVMVVFEALAQLDRYDFSAHPETVAQIESRVKSMREGLWKKPALRMLSVIKGKER